MFPGRSFLFQNDTASQIKLATIKILVNFNSVSCGRENENLNDLPLVLRPIRSRFFERAFAYGCHPIFPDVSVSKHVQLPVFDVPCVG